MINLSQIYSIHFNAEMSALDQPLAAQLYAGTRTREDAKQVLRRSL